MRTVPALVRHTRYEGSGTVTGTDWAARRPAIAERLARVERDGAETDGDRLRLSVLRCLRRSAPGDLLPADRKVLAMVDEIRGREEATT